MIEVKKREKETIGSLLRRFSKKVQQSGILINARKSMYYERPKSKRQKRVGALRREELRKTRSKLLKLGEIQPGEKMDLSKLKSRP